MIWIHVTCFYFRLTHYVTSSSGLAAEAVGAAAVATVSAAVESRGREAMSAIARTTGTSSRFHSIAELNSLCSSDAGCMCGPEMIKCQVYNVIASIPAAGQTIHPAVSSFLAGLYLL